MNETQVLRAIEQAKIAIRSSAASQADPYSEHMQVALAQINRPDYPAGMIPWLGDAHPDLYDKLTSRVPDEINLAWKCRAPLVEFDAILVCLVETHRRACELYRTHLQKPAQEVLERRQGAEQAK